MISFVGCAALGPMGAPAGDGGRAALTPSPTLSWESRSTLQVGALVLDFELGGRTRARILEPDQPRPAPAGPATRIPETAATRETTES